MTTLNELKIVDSEYSLEQGFFWIVFENSKSLQCCLQTGKKGQYIKQIDRNEDGSSEGLSGDNNEWALDEENPDWAPISELLHKEARKLGIKII